MTAEILPNCLPEIVRQLEELKKSNTDNPGLRARLVEDSCLEMAALPLIAKDIWIKKISRLSGVSDAL